MGNDKIVEAKSLAKPTVDTTSIEYLKQQNENEAVEKLNKIAKEGAMSTGVASVTKADYLNLSDSQKKQVLDEGMTLSEYQDKDYEKYQGDFNKFLYDHEGVGSFLGEINKGIAKGVTHIPSVFDVGNQLFYFIPKRIKYALQSEESNKQDYEDFVGDYLKEHGTTEGVEDAYNKSFNSYIQNLTIKADKAIEGSNTLFAGNSLQYNPYSTDGDSWWKKNINKASIRQGLGGLVSSAVEFGGGGMIAGGLTSALNLSTRATKLVSATLTNSMESNESGTNEAVFNALVEKGVPVWKAQNEANYADLKYRALNTIFIANDASTFGAIMKGERYAMQAGQVVAKKSFKERAKATGREMIKEGFLEEYPQDMIAAANVELALQKYDKSDKSFGEFLSDYTMKTGLNSALWGALGGPAQSMMGAGGRKLMNATQGKMFKEGNNNPGNFTEEAPTQPNEPRVETRYENPGSYEEFLSRQNSTTINKEDVAKRATEDGDKHPDKVRYNYEKEAFEKEYNSNKDNVDAWAKYDQAQAEYMKRLKSHEYKKKEWNRATWLQKLGSIDQAKEDVANAIATDMKFAQSYSDAVATGDHDAAQDLENQRFENLFLSYAKRGYVSGSDASLKTQLTNTLNSTEATQDEKATAKKFLDKLPSLEKTYIEQQSSRQGRRMLDYAFKVNTRIDSLKEVFSNTAMKTESIKADIFKEMLDNGLVTDPTIADAYVNKMEASFLDNQAERYGESNKEYADKLKHRTSILHEKANRVLADKEVTKENQALVDALENSKELGENILRKALTTSTLEALHLQKRGIETGRIAEVVDKKLHSFISEQIDKADDVTTIDHINDAITTASISNKKKKELRTALFEKLKSIDYKKTMAEQAVVQSETAKKDLTEKLSNLAKERTALSKDLKNFTRYKLMSTRQEKLDEHQANIDRVEKAIQDNASLVGETLTAYEKTIVDHDNATSNLRTLWDCMIENFDNAEKMLRDEYTSPKDKRNVANITKPKQAATILETAAAQAEVVKDIVDKNDTAPVIEEIVFDDNSVDYNNESSMETPSDYKTRNENLRVPGNISYSTGTLGNEEWNSDMVIGEFLAESKQNQVGRKLDIVVDKSDILRLSKLDVSRGDIYDALTAMKMHDDFMSNNLSNEDTEFFIRNAPIRFVFLNKEGNPLFYKNKPVYGYMHSQGWHTDSDYGKAQYNERKKILLELRNGNKVSSEVTYQSAGMFYNNNTNNLDIFDNPTLYVSDSTGFLWTNKGKNAHKTEILTNKTSGRIFTTVRDTKGEEQLVQLNGRKLTEDEAWATFKVIHNITSGASFHDKIKVQGFSGMTNGQFLSMVTFEGKDSLNTKFPLYINPKARTITIKEGSNLFTINFDEIENHTEQLVGYLRNKYFTTRADLLNSKLKDFNSTTFVWNNVEYATTDSYLSFIKENDALNTNANPMKDGKPTKEAGGQFFHVPVISAKQVSVNPISKAITSDVVEDKGVSKTVAEPIVQKEEVEKEVPTKTSSKEDDEFLLGLEDKPVDSYGEAVMSDTMKKQFRDIFAKLAEVSETSYNGEVYVFSRGLARKLVAHLGLTTKPIDEKELFAAYTDSNKTAFENALNELLKSQC